MPESVPSSVSTECLTDDDLIQASEGRLAGEALARALAHTAGCISCRRALEAVVQGSESSALKDEGGPAAPGEPPTWTPPQHFGPFRLGPELGRGAMGVVYRALNLSVGREVALKFIASAQPGSRVEEFFHNEAR